MQKQDSISTAPRVLKTLTLFMGLYLIYLFSSINPFKQLLISGFATFCTSMYTSSSSAIDYSLNTEMAHKNGFLTETLFYSPLNEYIMANSSDLSSLAIAENLTYKQDSAVPGEQYDANEPPDSSTTKDLNDSVYDELYFENLDESIHEESTAQTMTAEVQESLEQNIAIINTLTTKYDTNYLINTLYHVNSSTGIDKNVFQVKKLLTKDLTIQKDSSKPQILIYHTHAHETFKDSRKGVREDSIVGVADELTRILTEEYGYNVIHYVKQYEFNHAYTSALPEIEQILKENPSIQVVFDIHRDGISGDKHTAVTVNDVPMAKIMFFNGVSRKKNGAITSLPNKNLQTNLAFSLQMKLCAMKTYPELTKYIFLKCYRFNMHLRGRYSLIEVGDNNNTVAEAKASMKPLAAIINSVLTEKNPYSN